MRVTIAGCSFYLQAPEVVALMKDVKAEPVTGESVRIGRRTYPIKQVGAVITKQDRRDFSAADVVRAMQRLGFTCNPAPAPEAPAPAAEPEAQAGGGSGGLGGGPSMMLDPDTEVWPLSTPEQQL
ncbi:SCO5918 family protein [Streptacidiphilus cavernicola]|uniref:SCO5918 family protein n=1 Tax=Streptacidiphilus cavernicola TaxID=3342716 RepID=A0ABV6VS39_9ACTN